MTTAGFPPVTPESVLLTDRVAVVTGAAQGIGQACAVACARFGAHVAISDRDADGLAETRNAIEALGRTAIVGVLDVRDDDAVRAHIEQTAERLGSIDVLVNNAGGGFHADFVDVAAKGQEALIRENFASVTNFIRACVAHAPERGQSIVNMTSIEAHRAAPGYAVYAAMKAGVASLSQSLALELGARHIRVNCIAMDVIPTPGISGELGALGGASRGAGVEWAVHTPLPIVAHADDVAAAAIYLASDMSRFVTGTTIHVDGGNLAAAGWIRQADGTFTTGA